MLYAARIHVGFFLSSNPVVPWSPPPMRTRFDIFDKELVRAALEGFCSVETEAEVAVAPRHVDLWFTPREGCTSLPDHLGLLGRITASAGTFEFFHDTPGGDELAACLIKHGEFRHILSRRKPPPRLPIQWVISSGRPDAGIHGLGFQPATGWPSGVYESPPLQWTLLVVVNELPVVRDTLFVRLLGAGSVLRHAIAELKALPADAPERMLALPILVRLRLAALADPATQMSDDQEFLMSTEDVYETWRQATIQEGIKQGIEQGVEQGERKLLLRQLRRRFGAQVDGETEQRVRVASAEQIEVWAERVLSATTLAELLAD